MGRKIALPTRIFRTATRVVEKEGACKRTIETQTLDFLFLMFQLTYILPFYRPQTEPGQCQREERLQSPKAAVALRQGPVVHSAWRSEHHSPCHTT